ncbi:hypothetical protein AT6N2_C1296 [Agrobacterium tumefaciens]|nr:hypothetical protein AT6N2_C1296 [Agrobacterium tumefaciens]
MNPDGFTHGQSNRGIGDNLRLDAVSHAVGPCLVLVFQSDLHLFMHDHIVDFVTACLHFSSSTGRASPYHPVNNTSSLLSKRHGLRRKEVNKPLISEPGRDFLRECCPFVTVALFCHDGGAGATGVDGRKRAISTVECGRHTLASFGFAGGVRSQQVAHRLAPVLRS